MSELKMFLRLNGFNNNIGKQQYVSLVQDILTNQAQVEVDPESIYIVEDKEYGGFRNFCFVTFSNLSDLNKAISAIDGSVTEDGLELSANQARPREDRPRTGGGYNSGGRSGGYNNNRSGGYSKKW